MHCVILLLCPLQSGECAPGMNMGVSGDTEDKELEAALVEDGNDISQYCIIQSFVIGKSVYLHILCLSVCLHCERDTDWLRTMQMHVQ